MTFELLNRVEEGLRQLNITSHHPSLHLQYKQLLPQIPISCFKIPHKFFITADRIKCLKKALKMEPPSFIELVNEIIEEGSDKINYNATRAEERLELKSRR